MKRSALALGLFILICGLAKAETSVDVAASRSETVSRALDASSCFLSVDKLFKKSSSNNPKHDEVIPYDIAILNPACPRRRDYSDIERAYRSLRKNETESLTRKGLTDGCLADLAEISPKNAAEIAKLPDSERHRRCNQEVIRGCKVDYKQLQKKIQAITYFTSAPHQETYFDWTSLEKTRHINAFTNKVCSGAVSMGDLEKLNALVFSNTDCAGPVNFRHDERLKTHTSVPEICEMAWEGYLETTIDRKSIKSFHNIRAIYINGSNRDLNYIKKDGHVITSLDDAMIHELTHFREDMNPEFAEKADKFQKIRYAKLREQVAELESKADKKYEEILAASENHTGFSEYEKTEWARNQASELSKDIDKTSKFLRVPVRMGPGSTTDVKLKGSDLKAGSYLVGHGLIFGSEPEERVGFHGSVYDSYALESKHEYVAVAVALYRYNREEARKLMTPAEFKWLQENYKASSESLEPLAELHP